MNRRAVQRTRWRISPTWALIVAAELLPRCPAAAPPEPAGAGGLHGIVTVSGQHLVDGKDKPLVLHGINVVNKSRVEGYTRNIERSDFAMIRSWGMNCVRLGILWDGLEPQPGKVDEEYINRISRIIGWAKAERLYVLLDMHQDLYSSKFSDGAPAWATLDEGKPYAPTAVWSDAYFTCEAVQTALDHFWANSPGPDGIGLQDHYARVWRRVAERFRGEPAVLGYDLMNEPYPGHDCAKYRLAMSDKLVGLLRAKMGNRMPSPAELVKAADTADGRKQIADWLNDKELFSAMLDAGTPMMQAFERERLQPMYARIRKAIRGVDDRHIIFIEPAASANIGVPSVIAPLVDEYRRRDPQQAFAPHAYDIVTDTPQSGRGSSNDRIELIFNRHDRKARDLNMPLLIGEWGAYYKNPTAVEAAQFIVKQLDALQCSSMYWDYQRDLHESPLLPALIRRAENRTEQ